MRVRTDEKRQAILNAARAVFEEVGYARASMAAISARLGGSKATLYGYFDTKEKLFAAAMTDALSERGDTMLAILDDHDGDVAAVLTRFGRHYLTFVTSPEIQSLIRTSVAENQISDVGREVYELGPRRGWGAVERYVRAQVAKGRLKAPDPTFAAIQFKGLVEAGIVEPLLYGVPPCYEIDQVVTAAVEVFLARYGV